MVYMAYSEEKVSKFVQAITAYAEEQREKILQEIEVFKAERLQKAEQEVLNDAYRLIQNETASIRSEGVREMSRRDLAARKEVLTRRRQIMDEVFERAEKRLLEFTNTLKYPPYLLDLLKTMVNLMPKDETVYMISEKDKQYIKDFSSIIPDKSRIEATDEIKIGGIRAVNNQNGQIIDNTLYSKLEAQKDWFTISSGLTVG